MRPVDSPVAAIDGLVVRYPDFRLGPLSLTIPAGALVGLVGPNGSGKSTLLRTLLGLQYADAGIASILGQSTAGRPHRLLREVGYVPDDVSETIAELTPEELWGFHAMAHARISGSVDEMIDRAHEISAGLDFNAPSRPIASLSYGMRKKTQIVAGMLHKPSLLIMDEPRNGLDPIAMARLEQLMIEERNQGTALLLATHDLRSAAALADVVAILKLGQIVATGSPKELSLPEEQSFTETFLRIVGEHG
ncbi:MAG TPA: ABC transporter ATP-binding protein [Candidatus Limnocylindria bacterium]|jgi:ABC-2 type transport system ATP-binding protein|nr:ABC transporter ATP-binding protein [Candidatus Limnocylindria bacterium]